MKLVSIKTVDGNRAQFEVESQYDIEDFINGYGERRFIGFPFEGGVKYYNIDNVVSVTEYDEEE